MVDYYNLKNRELKNNLINTFKHKGLKTKRIYSGFREHHIAITLNR